MRSSSWLLPLALPCALLLSPTAGAQDLIGPGFALGAQQPVPVPGAAYRTLSNGTRVVFDGLTVDLYDAAGTFQTTLGSLPGFVFPSFVAVNPSETLALVGESSHHDLFRVDLSGGGLVPIANLVFSFDAVFLDETSAIVSAATCGFGCGSDLVRVDVLSGVTQVRGLIPGASGPLALGSNGDLYYTTVSGSFPPPPASSDVLRWSAAQVASGDPLTEASAQVAVAGLDGGASLAVDPVFGGILVAESAFGATSRIRLYSPDGLLVSTVVESQDWLGGVELRAGGGLGHFFPYQPADGIQLSYNSFGQISTIHAQQPQASLAQLGTTATLTVTGAPAHGALVLLWTSQGQWSPVLESHLVPALGFLLHSGVAPTAFRRQSFLIPADANGVATFSYFDLGGLAGTLVFQPLVIDAGGKIVGMSTAAFN